MKIVLAVGCFDLLHAGHVKHLEAAKALGDILVVSVTSDSHVNKGPLRPLFPQSTRREMVAALRCVDRAIISDSAEQAIRNIKPDVYVKGSEYQGKLPEQDLVESLGGRVVFTNTPVYSSTKIMTGEMLTGTAA
jgi:rfaE bifunctional protein nucleotidyltransferase chain/domain